MTPTKTNPHRFPSAALAALGVAELLLCLGGAHAQNHHRITTSYGLALAQAVPYALACWLVLRTPSRRPVFWWMIAFAVAFRLVALFGTTPYLSTDVYRYVWDGRVQGAGINPYRYVSSDPALGDLRDTAVYARMNRPDARTIYPPGAELFFFAVTRLGARVNVMRGAAIVMEGIALWAVCGLLQSLGMRRERVLLYAWHPLPVWEFAGSGHVDAAMIAALALALWAVRRGWAAAGGIALAWAALIKLFPVVLFPAFYRRWGWKMPLAMAVMAAAVYGPFLGVGWRSIFDFLLHGYASEEGLASGERFFLVALVSRVFHVNLPVAVFPCAALLALAGLSVWALFAPVRDALTPVRRAAGLAAAFTVLLSPGYAWYFAWLVMFLPFLPRLSLLWLTAASFVLYANWLHHTPDDFFAIHCVLYLPAAGLAAVDKLVAGRRLPPPTLVPMPSLSAFLVGFACLFISGGASLQAQQAPPTSAQEAQHALAEKLNTLPDAEFKTYLPAHPDAVSPAMVGAVLRFGRELGMHGDTAGQAHAFARAGEMAAASGDALSKARVLWRQAGMEGEFHHTEKGLEMINEAIAQATAAHAPAADLAGMLSARVVMYGYKGDYAHAMADCDTALRLATEANSPPAAMGVLTTLINIYQRQGQPAQSLPYLAQAQKWAEGNDHMTMYVDGNYAETFHLLDQPAKEQEYLQRALATARRIGDDNMVAEFSSAVAQDAREAGDFKAARAALDEAMAMANRVDNDHARVDTQLQLAQLEQAQGHHEAALAAARTALTGAEGTGEWESISLGQDLLGQALAANGQNAEAEGAFRAAVETIEQLRGNTAGGDESQQADLQKHIDPYQRLVALLVAEGKVADAFSTAENAKARVLRDILEHGRMDLSTALTDDERKRKAALEESLASLNRELQKARRTGQDAKAIEAAQSALETARVDMRNLDNALFAAHPEVLKRESVAQASTTGAAAVVVGGDDTTLLLEFVTHPDATTVFMVGPGKLPLEARTLPIGAAALGKSVETFRNALAGRSLGWREGAGKLGEQLLAPAADRLAKSRRVVVVPDGPLWDLPFQVLRRKDGADCLVDRLAVSYAPSAAFLNRVRQDAALRPKGAPVRLLAMGNPALGVASPTVPASLMGDDLAPLPEAEDEVRQLTALYGEGQSGAFLGAQAREDTFKREAPHFDILHLATHGLLNNANPLYSCLLMAQTDLAPGEDGLLEAREIMDLHLHARLAILAACETARGKAGAGEGQLGLSWALMVAGCPASVVSQWKVDSHSNTDLMLELHRQLRAGKPVDEALRQAELTLRKTPGHDNPFYWAPFVVVGDGG